MEQPQLFARSDRPKSVVSVGSLRFGESFIVIAGPCSVESERQLLDTAWMVKEAGADLCAEARSSRGRPPTPSRDWGSPALKILEKARRETGLPIVTEVLDPRDVPWVSEFADVLQIGARNIQNFSLLKEAGKGSRPVLLKRGMNSTLEEWLNSAEYILRAGNPDVILCERGIRTFEVYTRNTLDLSAVPAIRELSHLPIIVDPAHGTGRASLIEPMSLAAAAAGSDGLLIEAHVHPEEAVSDRPQTLPPSFSGAWSGRSRAVRDCWERLQ